MSIDVKVYREKVDKHSQDLSWGPMRVLYCQDVSKLTNEVEWLLAERDALRNEERRILPGEVAVPVDVLYSLLVSHVRYSMGRMTYIVGVCCKRVRWYWPHLEKGHREVLLRDVTEELDRCEKHGGKLGMDMDHREWVALREWMKENT